MRMKGKKIIIDRRDCYSLYQTTLRPVMLAGVVKFREEMQRLYDEGNPWVGVPHAVYTNDDNYEQDKQKWLDILDEIIYALKDEPPKRYYKWVSGPDDGKVDPVIGGIIWDQVPDSPEKQEELLEAMREHQDRVDKGLELFGKYCQNLWW